MYIDTLCGEFISTREPQNNIYLDKLIFLSIIAVGFQDGDVMILFKVTNYVIFSNEKDPWPIVLAEYLKGWTSPVSLWN